VPACALGTPFPRINRLPGPPHKSAPGGPGHAVAQSVRCQSGDGAVAPARPVGFRPSAAVAAVVAGVRREMRPSTTFWVTRCGRAASRAPPAPPRAATRSGRAAPRRGQPEAANMQGQRHAAAERPHATERVSPEKGQGAHPGAPTFHPGRAGGPPWPFHLSERGGKRRAALKA
jgi:hypothetical protein